MPFATFTDTICLSPAEAAKAIGIGKSTLFTLLARGEIKAKKLGSRTLITSAELSRYVETLPDAQFHAHVEGRA